MGECLITRRGAAFKLPVLSEKYPEDISTSVIKGNTTSATFKVEIAIPGSPAAYTYQWYVDGSPVEGETHSVYTISDIADTRKNTVYCEVTNKKGTVTSRIATLDVVQQYTPALDENYPADVTGASPGGSATFEVKINTAGVPDSYTYKWFVDGNVVEDANSSTYKMDNLTFGSYSIYCEVTNKAGTVKTRTANLAVSKGDLYNSGIYNVSKATYGSGVSISGSSPVVFEGYANEVYKGYLVLGPIDITAISTISTAGTYGDTNDGAMYSVLYVAPNSTTHYSGATAITTLAVEKYTEGAACNLSLNVSNLTGKYYVYCGIHSGGREQSRSRIMKLYKVSVV